MKPLRLSLTLHLTLLFSAVSSGVLILLGLLVSQEVAHHFLEQDEHLIQGKMELIAHLLDQVRQPDALLQLPKRLNDALVGHHDLAVTVASDDGALLFSSGEPIPAEILFGPITDDSKLHSWRQQEHSWHSSIRRLPTGIADLAPLRVAVAANTDHHQGFLTAFQHTLWLLIAAAAGLSGLLGWMAVRRGLAPLRTMRDGAAGVTASRLDYRLDLDAIPSEVAELANTLNEMLARLEDSFTRLKEFSSDLAHELRTPVSNLLTETQVTLARQRSPEEYQEIIASNAEEYQRLARMISDMLFLAQADHGLIVLHREPVDLAAQVGDLFDFFDALAEERHVQLSASGSATLWGDKLMLRRALANLLSNAIRHTPDGGRVAVRISALGGGVRIEIENDGQPIPTEHLARVFDRFYRADPSRQGASEGAGLGLAITRSIVRAHGGEIEVRNLPGGVRFSLQFSPAPHSISTE